MDELNEQFIAVVDQAAHKEMIVSHAAYGYWELRYGLKQMSISGLSSSSEPSQKELESLSLMRRNIIRVTSSSNKM